MAGGAADHSFGTIECRCADNGHRGYDGRNLGWLPTHRRNHLGATFPGGPRDHVPVFPLGTSTVNISNAALPGFLDGLAFNENAAILAGTAFVDVYIPFST